MVKRSGVPLLAILSILTWAAKTGDAQEPAAPTGPVSYWKFDETAGTTAANSVTGAPDGAYQGGVTISPNIPPKITFPNARSVDFNGTDAVINVPNFGTFTAMSVSVWIYRTGTTGTRQSILSFKETGGGFVLCLNEDGSSEFPRIWLNQGGWQFKENGTAIPKDQWVHLAATYDNANLRLYVDGVEALPATTTSGNMTQPTAAAIGISIGARNSHDQHWYPGLVDDARIYSRALTAPEVAVLAAGCPKPTALTSSGGSADITLSWTAPVGAAPGYKYNVKRSLVPGGPYTTIAPGVSGTTYVDSPVASGTTYYYVVSAVSAAESGDCAEVSDTARPVTALPNAALFTNESHTTTTFTIKFNQPAPAGGSLLTVVSSNIGEGTVSAAGLVTTPYPGGFQYMVAAGSSPSIVVTIRGEDDFVVDGPITYPINVTATNVAIPIPPVICTNNDNDVQGITVSRTAGLTTTEGGGQDSFTVVLNREPFANVSYPLASSNVLEGTINQTTLTFTNGSVVNDPNAWNAPHQVILTGVDDALLDFTVPYQIVPGALIFADTRDRDAFIAAGVTVPTVSAVNLDNEVPPELPAVWGGGGCGLLGMDVLIPLAGVALLRRRRR